MIDENGNEFTAVHLSVKAFAPYTGLPCEKIACMPDTLELHSVPARGYPYMRSDSAPSVTCPLCKETEDFAVVCRHQKFAHSKGQKRMT